MIHVWPQESRGPVKALHGVNLGPIDMFWSLDFTQAFRQLAIPSVRTHDANLTVLDTADLHTIFPDPDADPDDPAAYRFTQTDDYLKAILDSGSSVYFRLGQSIEHQPHKAYIRPERWRDPHRLARVCVNIARHYNHGWADGHEWGIRYWEFWNEPDIAPCWGGDPEQFLNLYRAVAPAMKGHDPSIKIGLAGFASPHFAFHEDELEGRPVHKYREVLLRAIAEKLPIDFISWHRYCVSWDNLEQSALRVRRFLDKHGLKQAESHLTEWAWTPVLPDGTPFFAARRDKKYDKMAELLELTSGAAGAAFIFGALARLQALPVDLAHYYTGIASLRFGLFQALSGMPRNSLAGFEVFASFLSAQRIQAQSDLPEELATLAVRDGGKIRLGIAHLNPRMNEAVVRVEPGASLEPAVRQYTDAGWRAIDVQNNPDGLLHIPLVGAGITMVEWAG